MRLNLRQKWILLTVMLLAVGMVLQVVAAYSVQRAAAAAGARSSFHTTITVGLGELRHALVSDLSRALGRIEADPSSLETSADQIERRVRAQLDPHGDRRLFWATVDDDGTVDLTNERSCSPVLARRIQGGAWQGGSVIGCDQMAAFAVYRRLRNAQGRGLVLGWIMDDAYATWMRRSLYSDVALFVGDHQIGSSLVEGEAHAVVPVPRTSLLQAAGTTEMVFGTGALSRDAVWYYAVRHLDSDEPVSVVLAVPRSSMMLGASYSALATSAISFLLFLLMGYLVWRQLGRYSESLVAFTRSAKAVTAGDLTQLVAAPPDPEMREFTRTYNHMLESMREVVSLRQRSAHAAGMADIASGVVHNIGNVLNSVNVSMCQATSIVRGSHLGSLERLNGLIAEKKADLPRFLSEDPRGQKLQPFMASLVEQLKTEQAQLGKELETITTGIDHIKRIVSSQQRFVSHGGLIEPCSLKEIMEEALRIEAPSYGRHRIELECHVPELSLVCDRNRVLQILINLLSNARHALRGTSSPCVVVCASSDQERVLVHVKDNGCGIAPEHRDDIFRQGFTTKSDGHGIGLHNSALAAWDMGGVLSFESEGVGKGASFTLDLPREPWRQKKSGEGSTGIHDRAQA